MRHVNWVLPLATVAAGLLLAAVISPRLVAEAGGLAPFDLRVLGYSQEDARAFLTALTPAGQDIYAAQFRLVDTVFVVTLTLTLCLPLRRWHWAWSMPALIFGLLDLAENWAVARLIRTGAQVDSGSIALASGLTTTKYAALGVAVLVAAAGLVSLWRARKAR